MFFHLYDTILGIAIPALFLLTHITYTSSSLTKRLPITENVSTVSSSYKTSAKTDQEFLFLTSLI